MFKFQKIDNQTFSPSIQCSFHTNLLSQLYFPRELLMQHKIISYKVQQVASLGLLRIGLLVIPRNILALICR